MGLSKYKLSSIINIEQLALCTAAIQPTPCFLSAIIGQTD